MTFSHGGVVRLRLKNFMQYREAEVRPGKEATRQIAINFAMFPQQ